MNEEIKWNEVFTLKGFLLNESGVDIKSQYFWDLRVRMLMATIATIVFNSP